MEFELTKQDSLWESDDHLFKIKNKLLADCIGISSSKSQLTGFNSDKQMGYALLSYFTSLAVGFKRLPFCEDRIYHSFMGDSSRQAKEILKKLNQEEIECIVKEVKALYQHTQKKLKELNIKTVNLRREISKQKGNKDNKDNHYVETIIKLIDSANTLKLKTISFEMDTLNSFTDSVSEYGHLADVTIKHSVPIEDIIYCSNLVEREDNSNRTTGNRLVETKEWIIINRSPTGITDFPIESVKYDTSNWYDKNSYKKTPEEFLSEHLPFVLRNTLYHDHALSQYGIRSSLRKLLSKWLMRNNTVNN